MSEKAHLKFDQFQNFLGQAQVKMMNNEFCDITLVSGDNKKIEAHRVILSASSAFFKNILAGEKHANPLIFMRGVYILKIWKHWLNSSAVVKQNFLKSK